VKVIGITGGIGTGKSTVTAYLASKYGLPIFDADIYARSAVAPHTPIWTKIVHHYSDTILLPDGTIDRSRLGAIIFSSPTEKAWLEALIHPYVRHQLEEAIDGLPQDSTAVLAIPLLFETQMTDLVTEIWVVVCDLPTQIERVMARDNLDRQRAIARIESQMPLSEKVARSDIILDNNSLDRSVLERQIDRLF
jgi:dephospho-CoA kinase